MMRLEGIRMRGGVIYAHLVDEQGTVISSTLSYILEQIVQHDWQVVGVNKKPIGERRPFRVHFYPQQTAQRRRTGHA